MQYPDQTRNLNPTPEAIIAMCIWGDEYSRQKGGSVDFWDSLSDARKRQCREVVLKVTRSEVLRVLEGFVNLDYSNPKNIERQIEEKISELRREYGGEGK